MISMRATGVATTLLLLALASPGAAGEAKSNPMQPSETWEALRHDIAGDVEILNGSGLLELTAPYRAHDAAMVPVRITERAGSDETFTRLTLVVDENPAPVVAEIDIGPAMGPIALETRVRVNAYSNIRALAETADGELYMVGRFVKASGGCSAPALKDPDAAMAGLGRMKLRVFDGGDEAARTAAGISGGERPEAQVMVRHPNYSGLQMDQLTQLYIPPHFVDEMTVRLGDELIFHMTGGISISEDPTFRFAYRENGAGEFEVEAHDTEGQSFRQSFPLGARPES